MINDKLTKELQEQITENKNKISNIIENGNGYTKYADGTLICYGKSKAVEIPYGSEYSEIITLPESYKDEIAILI